jgi:hypothetical protein
MPLARPRPLKGRPALGGFSQRRRDAEKRAAKTQIHKATQRMTKYKEKYSISGVHFFINNSCALYFFLEH